MKLGTARTAVYISTTAAVVLAMIAALVRTPVCFVLMILALTAELVFFIGFIRCPHCGRHLDRVGMRGDVTHCPFCGKALEDKSPNK